MMKGKHRNKRLRRPSEKKQTISQEALEENRVTLISWKERWRSSVTLPIEAVKFTIELIFFNAHKNPIKDICFSSNELISIHSTRTHTNYKYSLIRPCEYFNCVKAAFNYPLCTEQIVNKSFTANGSGLEFFFCS